MSAASPANDQHQEANGPVEAKKSELPHKLTGSERVALLMLALGNKHATKIASMLKAAELREIQKAMASLRTVDPDALEKLLTEFGSHMAGSGAQQEK
jgi:flagellar motor switch protein FliG